MKNQDQANNKNNVNDPTVANDPQVQVEDLPMADEQEERVKGGSVSPAFFKNCCSGAHYQPGFLGGVKVSS